MPAPALSLIVPTRSRADALSRFLASVAATAADLVQIEIVLVVDDDAIPALADADPRLRLAVVPGPPGRTMGALNADGYMASRGEFVMLLNDDVVVRTPGWDESVLAAARHFPDGVVLVHVNDTLMRQNLCTFPILSRSLCEFMGGICPRDYVRYCIDDHIEDVFNILAFLGERRTIYLPEVVFEHLNAIEMSAGVREYHADPETLALDGPRFLALFAERKRLGLDLLDFIVEQASRLLLSSSQVDSHRSQAGRLSYVEQASRLLLPSSQVDSHESQAGRLSYAAPASRQSREETLASITDPLALRVPGRQIVWSASRPPTTLVRLAARLWRCWRERGVRGLWRAAMRRLLRQR